MIVNNTMEVFYTKLISHWNHTPPGFLEVLSLVICCSQHLEIAQYDILRAHPGIPQALLGEYLFKAMMFGSQQLIEYHVRQLVAYKHHMEWVRHTSLAFESQMDDDELEVYMEQESTKLEQRKRLDMSSVAGHPQWFLV